MSTTGGARCSSQRRRRRTRAIHAAHTVTAARGSHGTASLQGSNLTVRLSKGVATFSGLSYNKAESMNIAFTTNAGGLSLAVANRSTTLPNRTGS